MTLKDDLLVFSTALLCAVTLSLLVVFHVKSLTYREQVTTLQNQIAQQSKTVEVDKGVYQKLAQTQSDLNALLESANGKDEQISKLNEQLKKKDEQLLTATTLVSQWKHAYEATVKGTQTVVPPDPKVPNSQERKRVDFTNDFGYIGVSGYTLTDPPEAHVKVQQNRPLKLSIALAQKPDGSWNTYVTSSEENVGVDVGVSGVDPYVLLPKWYEKIGVMGGAGLGISNGVDLVGSVGLSYRLGRVDLGPQMTFVASDRLEKFYGIGLIWHPFARN